MPPRADLRECLAADARRRWVARSAAHPARGTGALPIAVGDPSGRPDGRDPFLADLVATLRRVVLRERDLMLYGNYYERDGVRIAPGDGPC